MLPPSLRQLALEWAQQPPQAQPAYWAQRLSFVRGFARYRSATDPRTQIPADGACSPSNRSGRGLICTQMKKSAVYCALLVRMPCRYERWKLRPWVYYCLFGLLSVSGLRLGEARNLDSARCRSEGGSVDDPRHQVR